MRVRPRPGVAEIGQDLWIVGKRDQVERGRSRARRQMVFAIGEHDEHQPRSQPPLRHARGCRSGLGGGKHPWQVGIVELDPGKVIRFKIQRAILRLRQCDMALIEPDDVARPIEEKGRIPALVHRAAGEVLRGLHPRTARSDPQFDGRRDARGLQRPADRIGRRGRDIRGGAPAEDGVEVVLASTGFPMASGRLREFVGRDQLQGCPLGWMAPDVSLQLRLRLVVTGWRRHNVLAQREIERGDHDVELRIDPDRARQAWRDITLLARLAPR